MKINQRINQLIKEGNIPINELAEKLNVSRQQIARWRKENGSEPGAFKIKQICEIYQVSADWVLGVGEYDNEN